MSAAPAPAPVATEAPAAKVAVKKASVKKAKKASKVPVMKCVIDCTLPIQDKIFDINAFVKKIITNTINNHNQYIF